MSGISRRCANARKRHDLDFGLAETCSAHYRPNLVLLVERKRDVVKVRRILGKELLDDRLGGLRQIDTLNRIPDAEDVLACRLKHAIRLAHSALLVGKEHQTELANDRVERSIVKR